MEFIWLALKNSLMRKLALVSATFSLTWVSALNMFMDSLNAPTISRSRAPIAAWSSCPGTSACPTCSAMSAWPKPSSCTGTTWTGTSNTPRQSLERQKGRSSSDTLERGGGGGDMVVLVAVIVVVAVAMIVVVVVVARGSSGGGGGGGDGSGSSGGDGGGGDDRGSSCAKCVSTGMHVSVCKFGHQACGHQFSILGFSLPEGSPGTIASEGSDIPRPNFDPLPLAEDLQGPDPREGLAQARVFRPLVLPNERLYPLDVNELDLTAVKIANLEKQFKKTQGLNSIPDIEDGYTESTVRLPDRFKMPYIDRFDGSGDPIVHIWLFLDVLKPIGLTKPQKLSLYGRTLSGVAATWYAKLEDTVKQNWEELAEAFVDQYSYNTQVEITIQELETTRQNPTEPFVEFVARWRAKATQMTNRRPSKRDQVQMMVRNLEHDMLQKLIVASLFTFKSLHELGVQVENAFNGGIIPRTREPTRRMISRSTNVGSSTIPEPTEINTVTTANPFAKPSLETTSPARAQGRTFTPLYMSLTSALKVLMERGYLKPLDPQPLPDPLPARHNPSKYCMYHQQRGHGTNRCYRLRHEVQNLIDNRTIAPPLDPNDQTSPAYLNLIHILPSTYDPSIYITPAHLPKPELFIPESMDLCMMGTSEPKSSQTREPTTSELKRMIEDLQRTVTDLASGTLALSSTTSYTREFMSKGSPVLERAAFEECQSLGKVEANGKNKVGAGMDPHNIFCPLLRL
ncbi:hypothetical protein HYC85_030458 [Camellia sinensis]|uniref:Retrotransposon gag domain-containing protein n=1 Tax=Camellia sinensis TaxID=4442 RepID=A0A7J7G1G1_CAMSI|nr:hypothetical protein HYC85_030458 [Camellia sinensis]